MESSARRIGLSRSPTPLIVLTRSGSLLLTIEQRQRLWLAFRVPVFEQIIGKNGALLAAECEAHDGLHIESPKLESQGGNYRMVH